MHLNCIKTALSPISPSNCWQIHAQWSQNLQTIPRYTTGESYKFKRKIVQMLRMKNMCVYMREKNTTPIMFTTNHSRLYRFEWTWGKESHFHSQLDACLGLRLGCILWSMRIYSWKIIYMYWKEGFSRWSNSPNDCI